MQEINKKGLLTSPFFVSREWPALIIYQPEQEPELPQASRRPEQEQVPVQAQEPEQEQVSLQEPEPVQGLPPSSGILPSAPKKEPLSV